MESILPYLIWGGLLFLVMRLGCGAHAMGHGHGQKKPQGETPDGGNNVRWVAPEKAVDPACGTTVSTDKAKPSVFEGEVYYFCSRECREVFEAAPDLYLSKDRSPSGKQLEHSHG